MFTCCKRQRPVVEQPFQLDLSPELQSIDSLLQQRPDSALMRLIEFQPADHYRSLLLSEALYKTDNTQQNRDDLLAAMCYFDSLAAQHPDNDDLTLLSARSHYMNGVGYYEVDSIVDACREYLHTLEIMEGHFNEEDLVGYKAKFLGLTYVRLSELFSNQFMIESAIYCEKNYLHYCKIKPSSRFSISKSLYHIGKYYNITGNSDSAYYYYQMALEALPDSSNIVYRDIMSNIALLIYGQSLDTKESIARIKRIIEEVDDDDEIVTRYLTLGYLYYENRDYDTAVLCLDCVFNYKSNAMEKIQSANYLHTIYQELGDSISASFYAKYLAEHATEQYDNMMMVATLEKMFNNYLNNTNVKQGENGVILSVPLLVLSVIIMIIIVLLLNSRRKIKDVSVKYKKEKHKVDKLEQKIINKRSENERIFETFLKEPVCRKIIDMICDIPISARSNYSDYPNIKLDEETAVNLGEVVTKHFPNLKPRLLASNVYLKKDDLLLCYLYLLGLNNSQIAIIRRCSFSTIYRQEKRLKYSFKGCHDLPSFITKIAVL